ncbi:hypothetical protein TIFTF001_023192 [Ficus carica]|uniref:Uncharacterized protein n=1 Tax=Ficus carica TaxID=3494 RepID=A0AA88DG41_FICCA|nr:hypothetical protein TIFTF001_023192 [Ficus carica]
MGTGVDIDNFREQETRWMRQKRRGTWVNSPPIWVYCITGQRPFQDELGNQTP